MKTPSVRMAWPVGLTIFNLLMVQGAPQEPAAKSQITVGPNVQVTKDRGELAHAEVRIAADATHEGRLLAGSMVRREGVFQTSAYSSLDGGKTWRRSLESIAKMGTTDPAVDFGPDGAAYLACMNHEPNGGTTPGWQVEIKVSRDDGVSWSTPLVIRQPVGKKVVVDRPFLVVDGSQSRFRGNFYCFCQFGNVAVFRLRNGSKTFGVPTLLICKGVTNDPSQGKSCGQGVVLSDGAVVFPYLVNTRPSIGQLSLRVRRSTTGGETFHEEQFLHDYRIEQKAFEGSWGYPMMAVDPGSKSFKDRLYLVWSEVRSAGTSVMMSLSKDRGVTWSPPAVIGDLSNHKNEANNSSHYALLPTVAVNRSGIVGVTWYDTWFIGDEKFRSELRFRASVDGGATWLPSAAVTDVASTYDKGSWGSRLGWLGDTAGLAPDSAGAFHPLWIDNRTGVKQVFTASVLVMRNR